MKKSFSKTIAVLLAVLMVVCSLPMTVFAAGESRSNVQLQFGTYFASGADTHQTYVDENYSGFGDSGLNTAKLDYNKATGTITEASSGHTYGVGDFFTVSVLLENTSSLAASQVGIKYSDNIVPAAVGENQDGLTALLPATEVTSPTDGFAPNEAITDQSGNAIYNTASSTVGEISYIDADKNTMWANFAVQDGTDAVNLTAPKTVGVNTFTKTAVLATFGFKIVGEGAVTFSLADSKDVDSAYYVETIANGGKVEEYKTYTQTNYDGSTALDFMNNNENIESTKYTVKFVGADGAVISEAQYAEGATVTVPDLPKAEKISDTQHNTYAWDTEPVLTATANATYTAVATAEDHKWNAGVKQDDGSTLYTCTVCGATKSETAHVHSWGEWTYNGDAKYDDVTKVSTDGTQTRKCDTCGETETVTAPNTGMLYRGGSTLTLDTAILVKVMVPQNVIDYYDSAYMVAEMNTAESAEPVKTVVDEISGTASNGSLKYYSYTFEGITPYYLNEVVKYTFYGVKDGVTYWGDTYEYAVTDYVQKQFDKFSEKKYPNTYKNFRTLLADIIWYGYNSQVYTGYGITNGNKKPMTDYITAEQLAYRTSGDLNLKNEGSSSYETISNPTVRTGFSARMGSSVDLKISIGAMPGKTIDVSTVKIEVIKGTAQPEYFEYQGENDDMFVYNKSSNQLDFYYNGVKGYEASIPVYVRVLDKNGNVISNTRKCNVEGYCKTAIDKASNPQPLKNVCDAIMRYAKSSAAYIANKTA